MYFPYIQWNSLCTHNNRERARERKREKVNKMEIAWECASLIQPSWPLCIKKWHGNNNKKKKTTKKWIKRNFHMVIFKSAYTKGGIKLSVSCAVQKKNESCWNINQSLDDETHTYIGNHSKSKYRAMEDDTKASKQPRSTTDWRTYRERAMKNEKFAFSLFLSINHSLSLSLSFLCFAKTRIFFQ